MKHEEAPLENGCACDCECCQEGKCQEKRKEKEIVWQMRMNDTVGAGFLGILAILLLLFLVRANRRNRELLLEFIELRRQS
jgi:uncharacterized integral membrane protein